MAGAQQWGSKQEVELCKRGAKKLCAAEQEMSLKRDQLRFPSWFA